MILRFPVLLVIVIFTLPGLAQDQARNWVFGQGLGMHFDRDSVRFFNASWTPTEPNYQHDGNQAAVISDRQGDLLLYFLNGEYYDAKHNIVKKRKSDYHLNKKRYRFFEEKKTTSFIFLNQDTLLHFYLYGQKVLPNVPNKFASKKLKYILNQLIYSNGQWKINPIDSLLFSDTTSALSFFFNNNMNYYISTTEVFGTSAQPTIMQKIFQITKNGFKILNTLNLSFFPTDINTHNIYNPLTKEYFYKNNRRLIKILFNNTSNKFFVSQSKFPFVSPKDINTPFYRDFTEKAMEFSFEKRYLYVFIDLNDAVLFTDATRKLIRFDLLCNDSLGFMNSAKEIHLPVRFRKSNYRISDFKAGADGNLYFLFSNRMNTSPPGFNGNLYRNLGRIENPDDSNTNNINVVMPFKVFPPQSTFQYFPREIDPRMNLPDPFKEDTLCLGEALTFNFPNAADSVKWNFGVPSLGGANISFQKNPVIPYTQPGKYRITADLYFCGQFLRSLSDSLVVIGSPSVNLPPDTILCAGDSLLLSAGQDSLNVQYRWQDGSTDSTFLVTQPGLYHVTVYNRCDTVQDTLRVKRPGLLDLPGDTLICGENPAPLLLNAGVQWPQATFSWQDGSRDSVFTVQDSGTYWVAVQTACGLQRDTVQVDFEQPPEGIALKDTTTCERELVMLQVNAPPGATITWSNGETGTFIIPDKSGTYSVEVSNGCATTTAQAEVRILQCECPFFAPDAFTPNGDGLNDVFELKYDCDGLTFQISIYNRWGELVYEHGENEPFWDGTSSGEQVPQGVYVYHLRYRGPTAQGTVQEEKRGTVRVLR